MIDYEAAQLGVRSMDKLIEHYKKKHPDKNMTTVIINVIAKHQDECGFGRNVHEQLQSRMV